MHSGVWNWLWWFSFGIFIGVAMTASYFSIKAKGISLKWYEWPLAIFIVFLLGFTVQNFFGSFAEMEPRAAWLSLVFMGVPTIILCVIFARLVSRHAKLKDEAS
jgi:hypothetical protein